MASLPVTSAWSDQSASLITGTTYVVQNKSSGVLQFYDGATFDAATNDRDGVLLVPTHDGGAGPNSMRWTFDSTRQVRMRVSGAIGGGTADLVEFALAT